ncbi:MAG: DUF962 domain-containing protein [Burkholderiaceae bacterium]|nr:DUF962 domain-containing protein [Burkholderiaceae bacterium]
MKSLTEQLATYAAYHRDRRNIATHFVGIPLIVVAVATLLSRPVLDVGAVSLSPAVLVVLALVPFYLRLDLPLGLATLAGYALALVFGAWCAAQPTAAWLTTGIGLFVIGWVVQFIGHAWEGRKPAFVDDILQLVIGPLFVVAEAGFLLGLRKPLEEEIVRRAGPVRGGQQRA